MSGWACGSWSLRLLPKRVLVLGPLSLDFRPDATEVFSAATPLLVRPKRPKFEIYYHFSQRRLTTLPKQPKTRFFVRRHRKTFFLPPLPPKKFVGSAFKKKINSGVALPLAPVLIDQPNWGRDSGGRPRTQGLPPDLRNAFSQ